MQLASKTSSVQKALRQVKKMIETCQKSVSIKAEVTQLMKVEGEGNIATQGDINIYIINQQVLMGLYDLRDILQGILDCNIDTYLPTGNLTIEEATQFAVHRALLTTNGNRKKASKILGVAPRTLRDKLKKAIPFDPLLDHDNR